MLLAILLGSYAFGLGSAAGAASEESKGASSRRISYRHLSWSDFSVDDDTPGLADNSAAQTETYLGYVYAARAVRPAGASTATAEVTRLEWRGGFDRTHSWRRSSVTEANERLLRHEQGHFDINEIKLRELQAVSLSAYPHGEGATAQAAIDDLSAKLKEMYRTQREDLRVRQQRYDDETQSGTSPAEQDRWSGQLVHSLFLLRPSDQNTAE